MDIIYLNGQFKPYQDALIHIEDRGMEFADGVYEVILYHNNKLIDADLHLDRLFNSLNGLEIKINFNKLAIKEIILKLFAKNKQKNGKPTIFAKINQLTSSIAKLASPIKVITTQDIRWKRCDIKSIALIAGSMAKQKALDLGCEDAVFIKDSMVMEASFANVFMVDQGNNLVTRFTDNHILGGITRQRIINLAQENNIKLIEKAFSYSELINAKEVFITSSTLLVRPVNKIDNKLIGQGKIGHITKKLHNLYQDFINN
jgi:D-alanine transaminase